MENKKYYSIPDIARMKIPGLKSITTIMVFITNGELKYKDISKKGAKQRKLIVSEQDLNNFLKGK